MSNIQNRSPQDSGANEFTVTVLGDNRIWINIHIRKKTEFCYRSTSDREIFLVVFFFYCIQAVICGQIIFIGGL